MNDDDLKKTLNEAPVPEPIGGHAATQERLMGRVRHQYPADAPLPSSPAPLWRRSLVATGALSVLGLAIFLAWPERPAEAEPLPTEAQMHQFYDQHEEHSQAHLSALPAAPIP